MAVHTFKYADITDKIIGAAIKVHSYFGRGFPEVIYHRALLIELKSAGLAVETEVEKTIMYYEMPVGKRRIDLIVENKVLVELKAISAMESDALNQLLNCLNVFDFEVGLLLNFGKGRIECKRCIRDKNRARRLASKGGFGTA